MSIADSNCYIGGDRNFGDGLAKDKFCTNVLDLLNPKTTLNLFYGLMNVRYRNSLALGAVVRRRRQSMIEKSIQN
jgi:hypothetical protein